jgi:hypothetical protein
VGPSDPDYRYPFDRRQILRAAAALGLLPIVVSDVWSAEPVGSVEDLKGKAFADAGGKQRELKRASPVFVHDEVSTGPEARLDLHLGRDTTIQLGENARLAIDRFLATTGGDLTLRSGPLLFSHPAGKRPFPVRVHSPYGTIAVHGTRFFAGPSNGVFGVFVERGSVSVSAGGRRVIIGPGQGTNIARPGARPTRPVPWGAARIRAALESVS